MTLIMGDEQIKALRIVADSANKRMLSQKTQAEYFMALGVPLQATEAVASVHYHAGIRDMLDYLFGKDATPLFAEFLEYVAKGA